MEVQGHGNPGPSGPLRSQQPSAGNKKRETDYDDRCDRACHVIDTEGNKAARTLVAMAKVAVPRAATRVIDRAIQVHGGAGITDVTPLAAMYAWHRAMRLFDGPDEVHVRSIARAELGSTPALPPHLAPARG